MLLRPALSVLSLTALLAAQEHRSAPVDALCARWQSSDRPGLVVVVDRGGEVLHAAAYGMADVEAKRRLTLDTPIYVASVAKQFTAACIAHLEALHQIDLDANVRMFFPALPRTEPVMTVRHLLHHRSGLRDFFELMMLAGRDLDAAVDPADVLELICRQKALNFAPGSAFLYSNSGYFLLAQIVEKISERPLRDYAQLNIFGPLEMEHTTFRQDEGQQVVGAAIGYRRAGSGYRPRPTRFALPGSGGLYSSASDLRLWLRSFAVPQWPAELVTRLQTPPVLAPGQHWSPDLGPYAFGLLVGEHGGQRMVWHAGGSFGCQAMTVRFPQPDLSVVVLANAEDIPARELALQIADVFLPEPPVTPAPPAGRRAAGFAVYRSAGDDLLIVSTRGDGQTTHLTTLSWKVRAAVDAAGALRSVDAAVPVVATPQAAEASAPERIDLQIGGAPAVTYTRLAAPEAADAEEIAGTYHGGDIGAEVRFAVRDGRLRLEDRKMAVSLPPFLAVAEDVWICDRGLRIDVQRGDDGKVSGLRLSTGRARDIALVRY